MGLRGRSVTGVVLVFALIGAISVPVAPADAQWVLVARRAAGRIHHTIEGQQGSHPAYDFASVLLDAPAGIGSCGVPRPNLRGYVTGRGPRVGVTTAGGR